MRFGFREDYRTQNDEPKSFSQVMTLALEISTNKHLQGLTTILSRESRQLPSLIVTKDLFSLQLNFIIKFENVHSLTTAKYRIR